MWACVHVKTKCTAGFFHENVLSVRLFSTNNLAWECAAREAMAEAYLGDGEWAEGPGFEAFKRHFDACRWSEALKLAVEEIESRIEGGDDFENWHVVFAE